MIVRAELSGVRSADLRVNVDGEILRISGVRRVPSGVEVRRLHQMEIAFGRFERELRISIPFDRDGVTARLEDGFLSVVLPKHRPVRRKVEVETE